MHIHKMVCTVRDKVYSNNISSVQAQSLWNEGDRQTSNNYAIGAVVWNAITIASGIAIAVVIIVLRLHN